MNQFLKGAKTAIPIAIGYIPIAITFGLIAKSLGIPNLVTVSLSLIVFAGSSQFIGVNLMSMHASPLEIIMATFILNFRHFFMSSSLCLKIENGASKAILSVLAFGVTDESFAVASLRPEDKLTTSFMLGLNMLGFVAWNVGTWCGLIFGDLLPPMLKESMGIALYAMFIGLLLPPLKASTRVLVVVATAVTVNCMLRLLPVFSFLSQGWGIIIATIAGASVGAALFTKEVD